MAPQDGTFITVASQGLLIFEATGQQGLQTSIGNFNWLGSFTQSNNVTVTWHTSKTKTLADAIAHEVVVGASGAAGGSVVGPVIYNAVLGTKFKIVYGYQGGARDRSRHAARRGRGPRQQHLGRLQGDRCRTRSGTACSTC